MKVVSTVALSQVNSPVGIVGLGTYVPQRVLDNHELERMVDTSDEWIVTRTGIRERRICAPEESTVDLATESARRAIEDSGIDQEQIGLIICATFTPEHTCPSTACVVQGRLGIKNNCAAFDIGAACSGFVYAASVAAAMMRGGLATYALVIGADAMSKVVNYEDRNTCVLFGDGGGAVVLGPVEEGRGLLGEALGADGSGAEMIVLPGFGGKKPNLPAPVAVGAGALNENELNGCVPAGIQIEDSSDGLAAAATAGVVETDKNCFIRMSGNDVYKFAVRILGPVVEEALRNANEKLAEGIKKLKAVDLDLIVPHQANSRIIEAAAKKLEISMERFVMNIDKYGNTSAGTVPLALADARAEGRLEPGSLIAMVAFGGGLTYAASIWRW